jgi:biotin transport system substrate-specific component
MLRTDMDFGAALVSNGPFIPGDAAKVVVAALVSAAVLRAVPDLRRDRRARTSATDRDPELPAATVA